MLLRTFVWPLTLKHGLSTSTFWNPTTSFRHSMWTRSARRWSHTSSQVCRKKLYSQAQCPPAIYGQSSLLHGAYAYSLGSAPRLRHCSLSHLVVTSAVQFLCYCCAHGKSVAQSDMKRAMQDGLDCLENWIVRDLFRTTMIAEGKGTPGTRAAPTQTGTNDTKIVAGIGNWWYIHIDQSTGPVSKKTIFALVSTKLSEPAIVLWCCYRRQQGASVTQSENRPSQPETLNTLWLSRTSGMISMGSGA